VKLVVQQKGTGPSTNTFDLMPKSAHRVPFEGCLKAFLKDGSVLMINWDSVLWVQYVPDEEAK